MSEVSKDGFTLELVGHETYGLVTLLVAFIALGLVDRVEKK